MSIKLSAFIKVFFVSAASSLLALQPFAATAAEVNFEVELSNNSARAEDINERETLLAQNQPDYQFPFLLSLPEGLERLFFHHSGTTLNNWKFIPQVELILGLGNFPQGTYPELQIYRDADLVDIFYRDSLAQQTLSDPTIRTRDLPNPFSDSLFQHSNCLSFGRTVCGAPLVGKPLGK